MSARRTCACLASVVVLAVAGCGTSPDPDPVSPQTPGTLPAGSVTSNTGDYKFTALDVPAEMGAFTSAYGINSAGLIAGNFFSVDGTVHGFLFYRGTFTDVVVASGGFFSASLGPVNDLRVAAGFYSDSDDVGHAFLRSDDGDLTMLPSPIAGAVDTDPTGLNNLGTVVGTCRDAAFQAHGFIYRNGSYELFDYPGATSTRINGVNDQDVMVGQWSAAGVTHAFILEKDETQSLAFPGAVSTRAAAINNKGQIVGFYNNSDAVFHGFVYDRGEFTTLDLPGSFDSAAFGINEKGVIVGTYDDFSRGFVAEPARSPAHEKPDHYAGAD